MTDFAATFKPLSARLSRREQDCPMCSTSLTGRCDGSCTDISTGDTTPMPDTNPKAARAAADGKTPLELIETSLTHPMARVMAHGAEKYGVRNWREQPIYLRTYVAAIRRHNDAIADGEWFDPDSGEPHAAHVAACCQVILDARKHGTLVDDTDIAEVKPGGLAANQEGGAKPAELSAEPTLDEFNTCMRGGGHISDCDNALRCANCDGSRPSADPEVVDCGGGVLTDEMRAAHPGAEFINYWGSEGQVCCLSNGRDDCHVSDYCATRCSDGPSEQS